MLSTLLLAAALTCGDAALPRTLQEEAGGGRDFFDFDKLELGAWLGIVDASSDFESDPQLGGGLLLRAPMPWLSQDVLGMEQADLGFFVQLAFTRIDRDLDPEPDKPDASIFLAGLGLDYALVMDETWRLLLQAGFQWVDFGDVFEVDDGFAFLGGVMGGLALGSNLWIIADPQIWLGEGGDFLYALGAGLLIQF